MSTPRENTIVPTPTETRVYNLTVELAEQEQLKKASNKAFSDEIKRIKAEIKDILTDDEENEEAEEEGQEPI